MKDKKQLPLEQKEKAVHGERIFPLKKYLSDILGNFLIYKKTRKTKYLAFEYFLLKSDNRYFLLLLESAFQYRLPKDFLLHV